MTIVMFACNIRELIECKCVVCGQNTPSRTHVCLHLIVVTNFVDARYARDKTNRDRLLRHDVTPEAYEILAQMEDDDLEDDHILTQST